MQKSEIPLEKKSPTERFEMLKELFGYNAWSRESFIQWHKRPSEDREEVGNDSRPNRLVVTRTERKVQKIHAIMWKYWIPNIRKIADMVNMNKTIGDILDDELNITQVLAKLVLKNLNKEQKGNQK